MQAKTMVGDSLCHMSRQSARAVRSKFAHAQSRKVGPLCQLLSTSQKSQINREKKESENLIFDFKTLQFLHNFVLTF